MASTIPYPEEESPDRASSPGARLVIALSCNDPLGAGEGAAPRSFDLRGVSTVQLGRADRLEVVRGRLGAGEILLVQLPDPHLSSEHVLLTRDPDNANEWRLEDPGSTNGTWVNGARVTQARLEDDDVIEVGATILLFRKDECVAPAPGPSSPHDPAARQAGPSAPDELATLHPGFAAAVALVQRVAPSKLAVLLTGETGVGKEVFARALHQMSGRTGEFVAVNCGALPPTLIASELFGAERGAYSGAHASRPGLIRRAHQGTLLLDEIAELPGESQAVLLRVLQDGQVIPVGGTDPIDVDVRVLAATHQDLEQCVAEGRFRRDLLARLHGLVVAIPPLAERREDIGLLIARFLRAVVGARAETIRFTRRAGAQMFIYHWPNNVRELEQTIHATVLLSDDGLIQLEHLPAAVRQAQPMNNTSYLRALFAQHDGNISAIARALGTSRTQVRRLLERHGIT